MNIENMTITEYQQDNITKDMRTQNERHATDEAKF